MIDIKSRIFPTSSFPSSAEQTREDTVRFSFSYNFSGLSTDEKKMEVFFFSSSAGKAREVWIRLILHCFNVILFYAKMLFVISLIN